MDERILAYLEFLLLPPDERVRRTEKFIGSKVPPPWLDDAVGMEASRRGYTWDEPSNRPGVSITRISQLGRAHVLANQRKPS